MNNPFGCITDSPSNANILCYNIIQSATAYSQLAAILASFVFTAIILALGSPPKGKTVQDISLPLTLSLGTFISLLVSCYLFGSLAGEESKVRAFIYGYAASLVFTFAALQLLLSIIWYFKTYNVKSEVISSAYWLIQCVIVIVVVHMITSSGDLRAITISASWDEPWFNISWMSIYVDLLIQILFLFFLPSVIAWHMRKKLDKYEEVCKFTLKVSISLTVIFTTCGAIIIEFDEQTIKNHISQIQNFHVVELILCIIMLILALFILLYQLSLPKIEAAQPASTTKEIDLTETLTQEVRALQTLTQTLIRQADNAQALYQALPQKKTEKEKNEGHLLPILSICFSIIAWVIRTRRT